MDVAYIYVFDVCSYRNQHKPKCPMPVKKCTPVLTLLRFYIDFIKEPQNLRLTEWLRLVWISGSPLIPHLCSEQGQLQQVAQGSVPLGCEYLYNFAVFDHSHSLKKKKLSLV